MKKILLVAVAVLASFTAYQVKAVEEVTDLVSLENIESLGSNEGGGETKYCRWHSEKCPGTDPNKYREVCIEGGDGSTCSCGSVTRPC